MAATQKAVVFALTALLICSIMIGNSEAKTLDYSPIGKAPAKDMPEAGPGQANPYDRGCSPIEGCRSKK